MVCCTSLGILFLIFIIILSLYIGPRDLSLLVLSIGLLTIVLVPAILCCWLRALALLFSFPSV